MNEQIRELVKQSGGEFWQRIESDGVLNKEAHITFDPPQSLEKFAEAIVFRIVERIDTEIGTALDHNQVYAAATLQALALTILDEFDMAVPGEDDWNAEAELQKIFDEFDRSGDSK